LQRLFQTIHWAFHKRLRLRERANVRTIICVMLFHKLRTKRDNVTNDTANEEHPPWFVLPYVPSISEKFFTIIKNINVKLFFFSLNKFNKFIKVQKDTLPKFSNKNVVYKIPCKDCDAYVGQKGRKLFTIFEQSLIAITRSNQRSQTTNLVSIMNLI